MPWWWELTSINFWSLICQLVLFTFLFIQFYPNPSISSFSFPFSFLLRRRFSLSSCCDLFGIVSEVVEEWKAIIFFHFNPTLIDSNISPYRFILISTFPDTRLVFPDDRWLYRYCSFLTWWRGLCRGFIRSRLNVQCSCPGCWDRQ